MFRQFCILFIVLLIFTGTLKAQSSLAGTYSVESFEDGRGGSFVLNDSNTWMGYFRYVLREPGTPITTEDSMALRNQIRDLISQMSATKMTILNDSQAIYPEIYDEERKEMVYKQYQCERKPDSRFFNIWDISSSSGLTGMFEIDKDYLIQLGGTGEKLLWRKAVD